MSMNVYFRGVAVHLDEWQQKFFHADRPAMNESEEYARTQSDFPATTDGICH